MNRFWNFYFGDIAYFLAVVWEWIQKTLTNLWNSVSPHVRAGTVDKWWEGTFVRVTGDAWDNVVLAVAKMAGKPRAYESGDDKTMLVACLLVALFLFIVLLVQLDKKHWVKKPMTIGEIVMSIFVILATGFFALSTLFAIFLIVFGWFIVRLIIMGKALVTRTKRVKAIAVFVLCLGLVVFIGRAAYMATLLY